MLNNEQYQQVLKLFPEEINTEFKNYLKEETQVITFRKGATLMDSFSPKENIYFILSGSCIRYIVNDEGEERAIMFHTESFMQILSDLHIKREHSLLKYFVKMNEDTSVLEIDRTTFVPVALFCPSYITFIMQLTAKSISIQNQLHNHLIGLSKELFLEWLLKHYTFIFQRFRSKDIAHFMGVSATWLSLLKAKLLKK